MSSHYIHVFNIYDTVIVLFQNYFSPSGEQPEQHILAYEQHNQLPAL